MRVSRGVSSRVSRPATFEGTDSRQVPPSDEGINSSGTRAPTTPVRRGAGPYLVRSGSVYLFQIRWPKSLGGSRSLKPIRISLGACPLREARWKADLLAAEARMRFQEIENRMTAERRKTKPETEQSRLEEEWDLNQLLVMAALTGYLKAYTQVISQPAPEPAPRQARMLEEFRGLVGIARELTAQEEGRPHNPVVTDNAELLKGQYNSRLMARLDGEGHVAEKPHVQTVAAVPERSPAASAVPVAAIEVKDPAHAKAGPGISATEVPAHKLDRRFVPRPASQKPPFSAVSEKYLDDRRMATSADNADIGIAEYRRDLFIELIGDHPIDTYTVADLQAFINALKFWPARVKDRDPNKCAHGIIEDNRDLHLKPLSRKSIQEGYLALIKSIVRSAMAEHDFRDPFAGARLRLPETAAPTIPTETLSTATISTILKEGVSSGIMDETMLPLLGLLTGRRLGLLIHLQGRDIREKYKGVFVAQTGGIVQRGGKWVRVPYKTGASTTFFVLHDFFRQIGFVDWAMKQGDAFLFPDLMNLVDPSKSASQYMGRLFARAGVEKSRREVFHSLRSGSIDELREQDVDSRSRRLQVGHVLGSDEHELYGARAINEKIAKRLAHLPLDPEIDFSPYRGLDFEKIASRGRTKGRRKPV